MRGKKKEEERAQGSNINEKLNKKEEEAAEGNEKYI
jgi:hypothetical protein